MSKRLFLVLSALVVLALAGTPAQAGVRVGVGFRFPICVSVGCCGPRVYVGPPPVYVAPAPVYVVPAAAPVYVQPAAPPVVQAPAATLQPPVYQAPVPQAAPSPAGR